MEEGAHDAVGARKIHANRAAISNTCWMCTNIYTDCSTYRYISLSLSLSREESKNANTRPAATAEIKIKNCAAKNKNVDGGRDSRNWKKTNKKFKAAAASHRKYPSDTIYIYLSIWLFVNAKVSDWDARLRNHETTYRRDLWQKSETHRKFSSIFTFWTKFRILRGVKESKFYTKINPRWFLCFRQTKRRVCVKYWACVVRRGYL